MPATDVDPDLADLLGLLGANTLPLAELKAAVPELAVARAWAGGLIEFGRRPHCVTGPVGKMGSALVVEDGEVEWTGPKTKLHKPYRDLKDEAPPRTEKYRRYQMTTPQFAGDQPHLKPVEISEAEALAAVALQVRLTDAGLTAVGVA